MASAAAYSLTYFMQTLEMNALRGRSATFLAFVAARTSQSSGLLSRTVVVSVLGLFGTLTNVARNEASSALAGAAWSRRRCCRRSWSGH